MHTLDYQLSAQELIGCSLYFDPISLHFPNSKTCKFFHCFWVGLLKVSHAPILSTLSPNLRNPDNQHSMKCINNIWAEKKIDWVLFLLNIWKTLSESKFISCKGSNFSTFLLRSRGLHFSAPLRQAVYFRTLLLWNFQYSQQKYKNSSTSD